MTGKGDEVMIAGAIQGPPPRGGGGEKKKKNRSARAMLLSVWVSLKRTKTGAFQQ